MAGENEPHKLWVKSLKHCPSYKDCKDTGTVSSSQFLSFLKERTLDMNWREFSSFSEFPVFKWWVMCSGHLETTLTNIWRNHVVLSASHGLESISNWPEIFIYRGENIFWWESFSMTMSFHVTWSTRKPLRKSTLHLTSFYVILWAIRCLICFTRYTNMRGTWLTLGVEFHHAMVRSFMIKTEEQSKHSNQWPFSRHL